MIYLNPKYEAITGIVECPEHLSEYVYRSMLALGVEDVRVFVKEVDSPAVSEANPDDEFNGSCAVNAPYRVATIYLRRGLFEEDLVTCVLTIFHEVHHIAFGGMDNVVENRIIGLLKQKLVHHTTQLYTDMLEDTVVRLSRSLFPYVFPEFFENEEENDAEVGV